MKKDIVPFQKFLDIDFVVGLVENAVEVEGSKKLLKLSVDLGDDYGKITVFTGLKTSYSLTDFVGKKYLFVANLEPRPMMGEVSQGMLLCLEDGEFPILLPVPEATPLGARGV